MTLRQWCTHARWQLAGALPSIATLLWKLWATEGVIPDTHFPKHECMCCSVLYTQVVTGMFHACLLVYNDEAWHCVLRWGHNELEAPEVTLPLTYAAIRQHPPLKQLYAERLQAAGIVTLQEVAAMQVRQRSSTANL